MYYAYSQNNSGGSFDFNEELTHHVIIEANSAKEADAKLESLGGYFNGVEDDRDCECCGNRWSRAYESDGETVPKLYGLNVHELSFHIWRKDKREIFIYHKDGRKEEPRIKEKK